MNNNKDIPFIHKIYSNSGDFLYDVNTNCLLEISDDCWIYIDEILNLGVTAFKNKYNNNRSDSVKTIFRMLDSGFLKSKHIEAVEHPLNDYIEDYLENSLCGLILQVTQNCNLRCRYCSFSGEDDTLNRKHNKLTMSWEIAKRAIVFFKKRSINSNYVSFGFYGGEPLLQYKLIGNCISYIYENFYDKKIRFNLTTNGTIMNDEILKLLVDNNIDLLVSLDGPKAVHDKNRRFAINGIGSFDKVYENLKYIRDKAPDYFKKIKFNSVVELDIDNFNSVIEFFINDTYIKNLSHQFIMVSDDSINMSYSETIEFKCSRETSFFNNLINYVSGNAIEYDLQYFSELKRFNSLLKKTYELPQKLHNNGPCIPGKNRLHVDVNGNFRPCERVSETSPQMLIGNIEEGFDYFAIGKLLNIGQSFNGACLNCWAIRLCRICCQKVDYCGNDFYQYVAEKCDNERKNIEVNLRDIGILKKCGVDIGGNS